MQDPDPSKPEPICRHDDYDDEKSKRFFSNLGAYNVLAAMVRRFKTSRILRYQSIAETKDFILQSLKRTKVVGYDAVCHQFNDYCRCGGGGGHVTATLRKPP